MVILRRMHSQTLKTSTINYAPLSRAAEGSTPKVFQLIVLLAVSLLPKAYCLYCFTFIAEPCSNICCFLYIKYKIIRLTNTDMMLFLALQRLSWKYLRSSYTYFKKRASLSLDALWRIKDSKEPIANNIHEDWKAV